MMTRKFTVIVEWDAESSAWVTHVLELNNISTFGATQEEALKMTKDLIIGYLEASEKVDAEPPDALHAPRVVELAV
jgi:predicted RNase H-like HicB family nuclease